MQTPNLTPKQFLQAFRTHKQCMEYMFKVKYPNGFACKKCRHDKFYEVEHRGGSWMCQACGYQESAKAGTLFHRSKIRLLDWFRAIYEITVSKGGISATELQFKLGIRAYDTVWGMLHKLRRAMGFRDEKYQLKDTVELDAALFGHQVSATQVKVYLAVESRITSKGRKASGFAKAQVVDSTNALSARGFVTKNIEPLSEIRTDAGPDLVGLEAGAEIVLNAKVMSRNKKELDAHLPWVHKLISNIRSAIIGTHHGVSAKHMQRYLDEYLYRFNRRWFREQLQLRLLNACVAYHPGG
jgi:hypothetical protein